MLISVGQDEVDISVHSGKVSLSGGVLFEIFDS